MQFENFLTKDGKRILTYEYVDKLRSLEKHDKYVIPNRGGQEIVASTNADIRVYGGQRGGGKTFIEVFESIKDLDRPQFKGYIFRKKKDDFKTIIDTANTLLAPFGTYNKSQSDMAWTFQSGGELMFRHFEDNSLEDFKDRFQGREMPYIGIDEATQIPYLFFKYLLTCNRNAAGITNRVMLTCNPDPDSWLATFIDWWIGEDGLPISSRNGVVRYCFMRGDTPNDIVWGDTREEVYQLCRNEIDRYWDDKFSAFTTPQEMFIKSVTFIKGALLENEVLIKSDPSYYANLVQQDDEQRARDLDGNWKYKSVGTELITTEDIDRMMQGTAVGDDFRCVTCDVAFEGGDNAVLYLWVGYHIADIAVVRVNSKDFVQVVKSFLERHNVLQEHFSYDVGGVGQYLKGYFPLAIPFNNFGVPTNGDRVLYDSLKSEMAYKLLLKIKDGSISIAKNLQEQRYSTKKHKDIYLKDIIMMERKAFKRADNGNKNWALITKKEMIRILGWSPDFLEAMITRMIFDVDNKKDKKTLPKIKGLNLI